MGWLSELRSDNLEKHKLQNAIFVFESNLEGQHLTGDAHIAYKHWGAVWGQSIGLQGKSYAIPIIRDNIHAVKNYVDEFIQFAKDNQEMIFLVTEIGDISGFKPDKIAPLFKGSLNISNIHLPSTFMDIYSRPILPIPLIGTDNTLLVVYKELDNLKDKYSENSSELLNGLIRIDNTFDDSSYKYILPSIYNIVLPASLPIVKQENNQALDKYFIKDIFKPCEDVSIYDIDLFFNPLHRINKSNRIIETTHCLHTSNLIKDLENSTNKALYKEFTFYLTTQNNIDLPVSKRIGLHCDCFRVYCHCPTCEKLFCIGGMIEEYYKFNLIETNPIVQSIINKLKARFDELNKDKPLVEHIRSEDIQEMLKQEYDLIWYSPANLNLDIIYD